MTLIGILGGGQLGRMLALAGHPLGLRCRVLDPAADAPAAVVAEHHRADYLDPDAIARFARGLDVATLEFENVPLACAEAVARCVPLRPGVAALAAKQDRLTEKQFLRGLDVPTAPFARVDDVATLADAVRTVGLPAILKTRRDGYDGKGQVVLRSAADVAAVAGQLAQDRHILEGFVVFSREVSLIAARGGDGALACHPLAENVHGAGILCRSIAPAPDSDHLRAQAEHHLRAVVERLDYVGVLAIEFFVCGDRLIANELAPRVHNTGHWTIEGARTSQFENHLRAVAGLPLGDPAARGHAAMINLIGTIPPSAALLAVPGAHLHLYGKEPRPGRKVGHVTVCADDAQSLLRAVARVEGIVAGG